MFWLVDMRLQFYFAASDLFLELGYSDYIYVHVRQNYGAPEGTRKLKCWLADWLVSQIKTIER